MVLNSSWLTLAMLFAALLVASGSQSAYGVLLPTLEAEFGVSRVASSTVMLLYLIALGFWNVIAGWFTDRFTSKWAINLGYAALVIGLAVWSLSTHIFHLYLIHGAIISFGTAFLGLTVLSPIISKKFITQSGLALGFVSIGFPLGQLTMPPILAILVTILDWRTALICSSLAIGVLGLFTSVTIRGGGAGCKESDAEVRKQTFGDPRLKKAVYIASIPYFVCGFTDFLIMTHLIAYATSLNIGLTWAALSISLIGAFNIPALILLGLFADRFGAGASLTLTYSIRFCSFLILLNADTLLTLYLFAAIFGLTSYTTAPLAAKLVFVGYGSRRASTVYGLLVLVHMIGGAIGALCGGVIFDAYDSYKLAFLFSTLLLAVAVLLSFYAQKVSSSQPIGGLEFGIDNRER